MEKERILVYDSKSIFLKMFKRKFKEEYDFSENSTMLNDKNKVEDFDHSVYVIYDKNDLMVFFKLENKGNNVLVCLFDKQLYEKLSFLEEMKDIFLLDASKTRNHIINDLKAHFKNAQNFESGKVENKNVNLNSIQTQFQDYCKALFFLM